AAQPADRALAAGEVDEGVVDEDLRDAHGIGAGVAEREVDPVRLELRALDRDLLDGRPQALGQRVATDERDRAQHDRDQRHDRGRERAEGQARDRRAAGALGARLHQSSTSKTPVQPRSANSVLCAWNMNGPEYGKRSSQMPRCAWPWITVSVNSVGCSDVPVG